MYARFVRISSSGKCMHDMHKAHAEGLRPPSSSILAFEAFPGQPVGVLFGILRTPLPNLAFPALEWGAELSFERSKLPLQD